MQRRNIRELYYITHVDNIPSILERGILSHTRVVEENIPYQSIYDAGIVSLRRSIETPNGESLWDFANLFFQSRNPMLYRVVYEKNPNSIAVIGVRKEVLDIDGGYITTGNAASQDTEILSPTPHNFGKIEDEVLKMEWWTKADGSKRKMMAECLIPSCVPADLIHSIYVASSEVAEGLKEDIPDTHIPIIPEPHVFFQPFAKKRLTGNLLLVKGDMFFSRLQTLTVSVNTVGVMGRGVASRAKYQFPDVYVYYQDLCRQKTLKVGEPYLYKREISSDYELADDPQSMTNANGDTWFLLFPSKRHWREPADIKGIEKGLQWLGKRYEKEGIKSLAIPALGCGLGWLSWSQVGPILCKNLAKLDIPVWLYLPIESDIPEDQLTVEFLLE